MNSFEFLLLNTLTFLDIAASDDNGCLLLTDISLQLSVAIKLCESLVLTSLSQLLSFKLRRLAGGLSIRLKHICIDI